jgi:trehalose-6-phosphate synthase
VNMPAAERRRRMNKMRSVVSANNIYRWAGNILLTLSGLEVGETAYAQPITAEPLAFAGAAQ